MESSWIAYNELAWTEELLVNESDTLAEVSGYVELIGRYSSRPPATLLHLGCGAGAYDSVFRLHFTVTGVDISPGMLDRARRRHEDVEYIEGDMRTLQLGRSFDAVAIPDSIDYMATQSDLRKALHTAALHLKPGGVLLVLAKPREIFMNNNFAYTGEKDDLHVTLFENNYINPYRPDSYEATLFYLIRRKGELSVHSERHILGLFSRQVWEQAFDDAGLRIQYEETDDSAYSDYVLGDGRYAQLLWIAGKDEPRNGRERTV
jgi:SAM-dependent methyltransferase